MGWFLGRYVKFLEEERSRLLRELEALKRENGRLVDRLLTRSGFPLTEPAPQEDAVSLEKALSTMRIFEDTEEVTPGDEIIDNRKEKLDDFLG